MKRDEPNPAAQGLYGPPDVRATEVMVSPQMMYGPPYAMYGPPVPGPGIFGMAYVRPSKWVDDEKWICVCGEINRDKFCSECGASVPPKPAKWISDSRWLCECGVENSGKFCSECGKPAPHKPDGSDMEKWLCECGAENTGKYCTKCGKRAPAEEHPTSPEGFFTRR